MIKARQEAQALQQAIDQRQDNLEELEDKVEEIQEGIEEKIKHLDDSESLETTKAQTPPPSAADQPADKPAADHPAKPPQRSIFG